MAAATRHRTTATVAVGDSPKRRRRARSGTAWAPVAAGGAGVGVCTSDPGQLFGAEQAGRSHQEDDDHYDVRHDGAETTAEEEQLVLVTGNEGLGHSDDPVSYTHLRAHETR